MAPILAITIVVFFAVALLYVLMMLIRIMKVYRYRAKLIAHMYSHNIKCIHENKLEDKLDWYILHEITFDNMCSKFWKPCKSFFPPEYQV